jgi:hypothetical protein
MTNTQSAQKLIIVNHQHSDHGHDFLVGDRYVIDPAVVPKDGDVVLLRRPAKLSIWPAGGEIVGTAIERRRLL